MSHSCRTTISTYIIISAITTVSSRLAGREEPTVNTATRGGLGLKCQPRGLEVSNTRPATSFYVASLMT
ncbi:hypothetical protein EYF80_022059 [Liparis tanakae]|uniref:Uncharacterized protein n=1 Tax=Liparis tanakae TaxID=230148 RepID=A0A4Z2HRY2_9TELE|nr:hypothetical protein EYF80_022059 [Liparis tanakae]